MDKSLEEIETRTIYAVQGESLDVSLAYFTDSNNNIQDPSTWDIDLYIVKKYGESPVFTATLSNGALTVDGYNNVHLDLSDAETKNKLDPGFWTYYMRVDNGTDDPYYALKGKIVVQKSPVQR